MTVQFAKATKTAAKLRMAIDGPAGSGKTYSALAIATALGGTVAVVDTEHGSASKYADIFDFATLELDSMHPERYMEAIAAAEAGGFATLILDSLSHAWSGKDGVLEQVDKTAKRSTSGNSFSAWKDVAPLQTALVERILASKVHIIATLRVKTEYVVQTNERGKQEPKKVGLAPVQRDQLEYEFDVYGRLDSDNNLVITKTRCPDLAGAVLPKPGADLAVVLNRWLTGAPPPVEMVRSADDRIWSRWLEVLAEAQGLGVDAPELRLPIALAELKDRANETLELIHMRKTQLAQQETAAANGKAEHTKARPPSAAEKTAPRDQALGEVLDGQPRVDSWAENRRLVGEAATRKLTGVPTLRNNSTSDAVDEANAVLAERIKNYDLDQEAARQSALV